MILYKDAFTVATGELHAEGVNSVDAVVDAIKADAQKIGGDNSYKIDIGVEPLGGWGVNKAEGKSNGSQSRYAQHFAQ